MKLVIISFITLVQLFFVGSLRAIDNSDVVVIRGCFVDSTGQVDSALVRILRSMEDNKFIIETVDGNTLEARIGISERGIIAYYTDNTKRLTYRYTSKEISWQNIYILKNKSDMKGANLNYLGMVGGALLTLASILLIPTLN